MAAGDALSAHHAGLFILPRTQLIELTTLLAHRTGNKTFDHHRPLHISFYSLQATIDSEIL